MSVVDEVKARLDIVETVSGYVALQRAGRYWKARCPFHNERTPSFMVNPERQSWRCFGACATGGDAFSFVMRVERLDFGEALRLLAQKTGVTLSERRDVNRGEELFGINQVAARFYQDILGSTQGGRGREYLDQRGVNVEAISRFALGLSPQAWDGLKSHLLALGVAEDQALEAGLLHRGENGNTWDFFRGRLIFPIHDRQGRIVGFGARVLDDVVPKYLNTPKTPIFDKGSTLYGLHLAAGPIRTQNVGIVVEGYMDAIAAHQHGYTNVVASMGTALTWHQVAQLRPLATSFVLALDPDAAGQEATLRSLETSWRVFERQAVDRRRRPVGILYQREPLTLKIAALPPGRDPDKLIREDAKEWERLTQEAVPLMDCLIEAVAARFDLSTAQGKAQAAEMLAPMIASADFFAQEPYLRKLAQVLGVSEASLKASIGSLLAQGSRQHQARSGPGPAPQVSMSALSGNPGDLLEDYTLALLLSWPELKARVQDFPPDYFHKTEDREVFTRWLSCSTIDSLRAALDESLHDHLAYLTKKAPASNQRQEGEAELGQCLQRLERRHLQELQESLLASEDNSVPPPREMEGVITTLNARLKTLFSEQIR